MFNKVMGFARLARPANLPTAAADILAGTVLGLFLAQVHILDFLGNHYPVFWVLVCSSLCLYAGGVVLNDVFDAKLDAVERPERPIPKGIVSFPQAMTWGGLLLIIGVVLAFFVTPLSGYLAVALAVSIVLYDGYSKNFGFLGPLNMGLCRGLNLLLGMSIIGSITVYWVALVPLVYIFAVTLISRGEVHGNNRNHLVWSGALYLAVILAMGWSIHRLGGNLSKAALFFVLFSAMLLLPLFKAYRENSSQNIKKAVISGVLSVIVMDACWVAGFSDWPLAAVTLLLLPLALLLSKMFAVT